MYILLISMWTHSSEKTFLRNRVVFPSVCTVTKRHCDKEESYLHLKFPFLCVFTYAATAIRSVTIFGHGIMMSLLLVLRWCFCVLHMFFLLKLISHPYHKQKIIMASNGHDDFHCASILLFVLIIAKHCIAHLNTHLHTHTETHTFIRN